MLIHLEKLGKTFGKKVVTLFPYTTLFRSSEERRVGKECKIGRG